VAGVVGTGAAGGFVGIMGRPVGLGGSGLCVGMGMGLGCMGLWCRGLGCMILWRGGGTGLWCGRPTGGLGVARIVVGLAGDGDAGGDGAGWCWTSGGGVGGVAQAVVEVAHTALTERTTAATV
jgi:hypothetical protein